VLTPADLLVARLVVLFLCLVAVVYLDMTRSKIPNELTGSAVIIGFLLALVSAKPFFEVVRSLWGLAAGAGPFMAIYLLGLSRRKNYIGAGDVKLMAGIGAFLGPWGSIWTIYYAIWIAGGVALIIACYCAIRRRRLPKTLQFGTCIAFGAVSAVLMQGSHFLESNSLGDDQGLPLL